MSGIAIAAPTIPGSVATFCSCSSDESRSIACSSSSSANSRAGTRISGRASRGISHVTSSMRCKRGLDIENDASVPRLAASRELESVIGRGLDQRLDLRSATPQANASVVAVELHLGVVGDEALGVGEVDQLLEQIDEQRASVTCLQLELARRQFASAFTLDQAAERVARVREDLFL